MHEVSGRFFEKKLRKKLFAPKPVLVKTPVPPRTKFFAELFFKKATTYFLTEFLIISASPVGLTFALDLVLVGPDLHVAWRGWST